MDETAWSKYPQRRDCRGPTVRRDQEIQAACRQLLSTEEAPFPGKGCQAGAAQADRWRE